MSTTSQQVKPQRYYFSYGFSLDSLAQSAKDLREEEILAAVKKELSRPVEEIASECFRLGLRLYAVAKLR